MSKPIDFSFKPQDQEHVARIAQVAGDTRTLVRLSYQNQIQAKAEEYEEDASPQEAEERQNREETKASGGPLPENVSSPAPRDPGSPPWLPKGTKWHPLPPDVRLACEEIVQPAYDELVVHAPGSLEKSIGASIVHLLWLEILDQFDIKEDYTRYVLTLKLDGNRKHAIDQYLKLVNSKLRLSHFLLRLRKQDSSCQAPREASSGERPAAAPEKSDMPTISPLPAPTATAQSALDLSVEGPGVTAAEVKPDVDAPSESTDRCAERTNARALRKPNRKRAPHPHRPIPRKAWLIAQTKDRAKHPQQ